MTNYSTLPALVDERLAGGRVTVDLDALVANWRKLDGYAPNSRTAAAVKADAYGLGVEPVVKSLSAAGCDTFFVALPEEGIRVRRALPGANIYVLGGLFKNAAPAYAEAGLMPVLGNLGDIEQWSQFWKVRSTRKPCALHVDTGMNRLGLSMDDAQRFSSDDNLRHSVSPLLIMSHLACADDPEHEMNLLQQKRFREVMRLFPENEYSIANSAAVIAQERFYLDVNRPGIALYGGKAVNGIENPMQSVATLEGRIIQIRSVKAGEHVGYGATQTLKRDSKLAVAAIGYGDGYSRANSGSGIPLRSVSGLAKGASGWLDGYRVPICGRVSMDMTSFDVTDVPDQVLEDAQWIEFFGKNIAVDEVAKACGTIGYELLTGLGPRYSRSYITNSDNGNA